MNKDIINKMIENKMIQIIIIIINKIREIIDTVQFQDKLVIDLLILNSKFRHKVNNNNNLE